jgi:gluconokinase
MIIIVAGVSGSGKTTVGSMLAGSLHWRFVDADDFHPPENIAKMRAGIPLTDQDRWPWLRALGAWMDGRIERGESAVMACSALRRAYRDALLGGRPEARMFFLAVDRDACIRRLAARHGHFFPGKLLASQFDCLEPPQPDETAVTVLPSGDPADTVAAIIALVRPGEGTDPGSPAVVGDAGGDHEAEA